MQKWAAQTGLSGIGNNIILGGGYWGRQVEKELEWHIEVGTTLTHCVNV